MLSEKEQSPVFGLFREAGWLNAISFGMRMSQVLLFPSRLVADMRTAVFAHGWLSADRKQSFAHCEARVCQTLVCQGRNRFD